MKKDLTIFLIIIVVAALVILGIGYLASQNKTDSHGDNPADGEGITIDLEGNGDANYTITQLPDVTIEEIAPDPRRPVQFGESVPQEVRTILAGQAAQLGERLEEDLGRADDWFNLAVIYHNANDYEGAEAVWEFLTKVVPNSATAYDNLGKLHHYSLREFGEAERYFMESIQANPSSVTPYLELHELYKHSFKTNTTAAVDIIEDALEKFPSMIELYTTLGIYHRDRGETAKARAAFTTGLDLARDANNVDLITVFGNELGRLPQ